MDGLTATSSVHTASAIRDTVVELASSRAHLAALLLLIGVAWVALGGVVALGLGRAVAFADRVELGVPDHLRDVFSARDPRPASSASPRPCPGSGITATTTPPPG